MFGKFSSKSSQKDNDNNSLAIKVKLVQSYFPVCAEKCLPDLSKGLDDQQKVCLAKCLDRAHDYLIMAEKRL